MRGTGSWIHSVHLREAGEFGWVKLMILSLFAPDGVEGVGRDADGVSGWVGGDWTFDDRDAQFVKGVDMAEALYPAIKNFPAGVKIFKGDAQARRLLAGAGGIVKEGGCPPDCGGPLCRIGEALEEEIGG